ncbi:MAG: site-specific integrase [Mucilaginibacter sp.]|nr:site-specific integrase [Mucilaginibacter sp.]
MANVTIRKKSLSKNRQSLYLDYSPPIFNSSTNKIQRYEFLKIFVYNEPINRIQRKHNKETAKLAEWIRLKRNLDIQNRRFGFLSESNRGGDFVNYFKKYTARRQKTNSDNMAMAFRYYEDFISNGLKYCDLNESICEGFRSYLLSGPGISFREKPIARNTAVSYFAKFRSALKEAYSKGLLAEDLYSLIKPIKASETHRERLDLVELQKLISTPISPEVMKSAAIFSALTGLRFSDVKTLKWAELRGRPGKNYLQYHQQKTMVAEYLPISDDAVKLMGKRKGANEAVFKSLAYSSIRIFLVRWLTKAGIKKNITFHCFRHTYATLQLEFGTDVYTVSKMLGHKHIKTTQVYAKVVDRKKNQTVNKIKVNIGRLNMVD